MSKTILSGVRPEELEILAFLSTKERFSVKDFQKFYFDKYHRDITDSQVDYALDVLEGEFVSKDEEYQRFKNIEVISTNRGGMITRMSFYGERLQHNEFKLQVEDIIRVGLARYRDKY